MFEQTIANLLNRVIGDYVQDLETKQLNVGIWAGDVQLRNLRLRPDALVSMGLPIHITEGSLGLFLLKIPWKNLKSDPIRILIDNVSLIAGPRNARDIDPAVEAERVFKEKLKVLAAADSLRFNAPTSSNSKSQQESYSSQLITKLIDNIQVAITNISVQFVDPLSVPSIPYCVIFKLQELSVVSVNEDWQEKFIESPVGQTRKLLKLRGLAIQWNNTDSKDDNGIESCDKRPMLYPVHAEGRLTINKKFGPNVPQVDLALDFDSFDTSICRGEYKSICQAGHYFRTLNESLKFIHFRIPPQEPRTSIALWKYAIDASRMLVHNKIAPKTWQFIASRRRTRLEYMGLARIRILASTHHYTKGVSGPVQSPITTSDLDLTTHQHGLSTLQAARLCELQKILSIRDLLLFEEWTLHELRKEARHKSGDNAADGRLESPNLDSRSPAISQRSPHSSAQTDENTTNVNESRGWGSWWPFSYKAPTGGDLNNRVFGSSTDEFAGAFPTDSMTPTENSKSPSAAFSIEIDDLKRFLDLDDLLNTSTQAQHNLEENCLLLRVSCNLKTGSFRLERQVHNEAKKSTKAIYWSFGDLSTQVIMTLDSALSVFTSMGTFTMTDAGGTDASSDQRMIYPAANATQCTTDLGTVPALFATHIKHNKVETIVSVTTQPLVIICRRSFIDEFLKFFKLPDNVVDDFAEVVEAVRHSTKAGLQYALEMRRTVNIKMDISAPVFLVPILGANASVLGIDTGRFRFTSRLPDSSAKSQLLGKAGMNLSEIETDELLDMLVDVYDLQLTHASIFLGRTIEDCLCANKPNTTVEHIVKNLDIMLTVKRTALPQGVFASVPALSILTILPSVDICLSNHAYSSFILAIASLSSTSDTTISQSNPPVLTDIPEQDTEAFVSSASEVMELLDVQFHIHNFKIKLGLSPGTVGSSHGRELAEIELGEFKFSMNEKSNGQRNIDIILSSILIRDLQQKDPALAYLMQSGSMVKVAQSDSLGVVRVQLNQKPEDSVITITLNSIHTIITRESMTDLYQFALLTFMAKSAATEQSDSPAPQPFKTRNRVVFLMHGVTVLLNDCGDGFANLHLGESSLDIVMESDTMSVNGSLGALRIGLMATNESIAQISGPCTAKFRYDSNTAWALSEGFDSKIKFDCESLVVQYMPTEINRIIAFLSAFTTAMVDVARNQVIKTVDSSTFGWDVRIEAPIIVYKMDGNELHGNLGSLSAYAVPPCQDLPRNGGPIGIKASLQNVCLFTRLCDEADQTILHEMHLLVSMRNRHLSINLSPVACTLTKEQWIFLSMIPQSIASTQNNPTTDTQNPEPHESVEQEDPPSDLEISFSCDAIQLNLKGVLFAELNSFYFNVILGVNMTLEGGCSTLLLNDLYTDESQFLTILTSKTVQPFGHAILFNGTREGERTPWILNCTADMPKATVYPSFFLGVQKFFAIPPNTSAQALKSETSSIQPANSEPEMESVRFHIKLVGMEICFIHQASEFHSPALVLATHSIQVALSSSPFVQVKGMSAHVQRMNSNHRESRILHDFTISLVPKLADITSDRSARTFSLTISKLEIRISYRHVNLLLSVLNMWSQAFAVETPRVVSDSDLTFERSQLVKHEPPPKTTAIKCNETMHVTSEGIRILIVDDLDEESHGPVIDCLVSLPRPFDINDWTSALQIKTSLDIRINLWNPHCSSWEPLLEQCKLQIKIHSGDTFNADIQTKRILEANVTKTLIQTLNRVTSEWPSTVQLSSGTSHGTIKFFNATGHLIRVTPTKQSGMIPIEIAPDSEGQFPETGDIFEVAESALAQVQISVIDSISASTEPVIIARGIDRVVPLKSGVGSMSKSKYGLYFNVTSKIFSKHVQISSPYCVRNMTFLTLDVMCGEQTSVIRPKEDFFIALKYMDSANISVRPHGAHEYAWSGSISLNADQTQRDFIASCMPINKTGYKFTLVSHIVLKHENVSGIAPLTILQLHSPLTIENNLPEAIQFQVLSEHNDIPPIKQVLESGVAVSLGIFNLQSPIGVLVQIPKLHINLSSPAIIPSIEDVDATEQEDVQNVPFGPSNIIFKIRSAIPSGIARIASIFTPFVLQNRLPVPLDVQCYQSKGFLHLNRDTISICTDSKVALRVGGADTSPFVNLSTIAGTSGIILHSVDTTRFLHIGIAVDNGNSNASDLSSLVTFNPRFIIHNVSKFPIEWKQVNTTAHTSCDCLAQSPIMWLHKALKNQIVCRLTHAPYDWSSPLELNEMGETFLRVNPLLDSGKDLHPVLLSVMATLNKSCIDIQISVAKGWPFRIENMTSYPIKIAQNGQQSVYSIAVGQYIQYSLDDPTGKKALVLYVGSSEHVVNLFEIGSFPPFGVKVNGRPKLLEHSVLLEDNVRVLRVKKYHADRSIYRASGQEKSANHPPPNSPISFELVNVPLAIKWSVLLDLDLGLSIVDESQEIAYCSLRHWNIGLSGNDQSRSIESSIHWIQIDNQMLDATEDIALYPSDIIRGSTDRHVLRLSISQSTTNQQFFKNFTVLLQELSISIDREFIMALVNYTQSKELSDSKRPWSMRLEKAIPRVTPEKSHLLYFENFAIHPIQLNLTFSLGSSEESGLAHMPLGVLSASLANISHMPVPIEGLIVNNLVATPNSLANSLSSHFYDQAIQKLYSVLGSVDLLGNPVQLWGNISSGVKSFFIEPYAMSMERPQDIGFGIAKGGAALVGKTVYGFADGFARFSSSVGRGLAAATMDKRFQQSRARARRRNRPKHGLSGVAVGVRSLGSNLVSAATGVIQQPIQGASEAGLSGFMKGVARAGLGLVVKPVLGIADAANSISEGIRNTTTVLDDSFYEIERVRLPRVLQKGSIQAYSEREALGQFWLMQIDGGKGRYVSHFETKQEDYVIIVSDMCILLARLQSLHADWIVKWQNIIQLDSKLYAHSIGQEPLYFFRIVQTNGDANVIEARDPKALDDFRIWLLEYIQGNFA